MAVTGVSETGAPCASRTRPCNAPRWSAMFIGAGACACSADATALDATITRAIAAGPHQRVQILADQHVISTSSPAAARRDEPPDCSHLRGEDQRDCLKTS